MIVLRARYPLFVLTWWIPSSTDHRLEEARAHEQVEDFARQEKILKLISTELTRNTTRVVEMAVKNEVQNSVLPSLETITRTEVKAALNDHVGQGLVEFINQVCVPYFSTGLWLTFAWCAEPARRDRKTPAAS